MDASVVPPLNDPRCLVTPDAVVVDGANGVCHEPRFGPHVLDAWALGAALAVAVAAAILRRRGSPPRASAALLALALAVAAPGLWAVATQRADAPLRASTTTAQVLRLFNAVNTFAIARGGCVSVSDEGCVACEPIVRMALPIRPQCAPRGLISLGAEAFAVGCHETDNALICGGESGLRGAAPELHGDPRHEHGPR